MKTKFFIFLISVSLLSITLIACQQSNCQEIDDEIEKNPDWIGSATVERSNLGQGWKDRYYWKNDFGLFLDFNNRRIGMGNGPVLPKAKFFSDFDHQWYLCEKPNGYLYATLRKIDN